MHTFEEPKKFLVCYKNVSKVIRVIDTEEIKALIQDAFYECPIRLPTAFDLQYWDKDFEIYIDIGELDIEPYINASRLNVIKRIISSDISMTTNDVTTNDSMDVSKSSDEICESSDEMIQSSSDTKTDESISENTSSISSLCESVKCVVSSTPTKKLLWPQPFILKDEKVPPLLLNKLKNKEDLKTGDYTSLISCLFDECTKITYNPKPWQYDEMIHFLLSRWKYLMRYYPTERDAKWDLKKKVRSFFKNTRKRKCVNVEEVRMAKAKYSKKPVVSTPNVWGVKNFLPNAEEGEDERTISLHVEKMKEQFVNHPYKRKNSIIEIAMKKTFATRRNMIISGTKSVADIIDEFPMLGDGQQLLLEFERTTEMEVKSQWDIYFKKFAPSILKLKAPKLSKVAILENEIDKLADRINENDLVMYAVMLLPSLLREDMSVMFQSFGLHNHPQIQCTGDTLLDVLNSTTYKVIVDGVKIGQTDSLVTAIQLFFSAFYVFNLVYPKDLNGTLLFIQKEVLMIHDSLPPLTKVINLITKLKKDQKLVV